MHNQTVVIKIGPIPDDPKVTEVTPQLLAELLADYATSILLSDPPLTVVPEVFSSGGLTLEVKYEQS